MAHYGSGPTASGTIPDHLAVLFEFMGRGIRGELEDAPAVRGRTGRITKDIQRVFFRGYVEPWVERFFARVRAARPAPFYDALIALTAEFLAHEARLLAKDGSSGERRVLVGDLRRHAT